MKKLLLTGFVLASLVRCGLAQAPPAPAADRDLRRDLTPGVVSPTPEMWFYEQERTRYDDPKLAVRRRAEFKAAQRTQRTTAMKWFGMSNARPTASPIPYMSTSSSPHWVSGGVDPSAWRGTPAFVVVRPGTGSTY